MSQDDWTGCYDNGWKGLIVEDAFAHPAKFSRALITRMIQHAKEEGWIVPGSLVLDPFGGVALGALAAMQAGCRWLGVELEEKFVALGNKNLALWNQRFSSLPGWGTARLLRGDSRQLVSLLSEQADCCVSSPPFSDCERGGTGVMTHDHSCRCPYCQKNKGNAGNVQGGKWGLQTPGQLGAMKEGRFDAVVSSPPYNQSWHRAESTTISEDRMRKAGYSEEYIAREFRASTAAGSNLNAQDYGVTEGQLGAMKEGDFSLIASSPPFMDARQDTTRPRPPASMDGDLAEKDGRLHRLGACEYGSTDGQLGAMKEGRFDAVVASPPFGNEVSGGDTPTRAGIGSDGQERGGKTLFHYGTTPGQLGALPPGNFDLISSSPPYEGIRQDGAGIAKEAPSFSPYSSEPIDSWHTQRDQANLGNTRADTFWSAARQIVEQSFLLLKPGAVSMWVVKGFVRKGKLVDFPHQWQALCESVGFQLLHEHHAMLTTELDEQFHLDGSSKRRTVERKSFFRRLAEKKGSPKIDYETILCLRKPYLPIEPRSFDVRGIGHANTEGQGEPFTAEK